ncbi:MAG: nuclear transport factor 2 family protein [Burkholderiales bacterium]|nr:nuclear transport factor 2 family protein [Burkholderiales bacterium]
MNSIRAARAFLAAVVLAAFPFVSAVAGDAEDVDAAEEARYAVMIAQDRAALAAILADEFIYHQPSGRVQDKAGYIEQVTGGDVRIKKAERYDIRINVYGTSATATGSTRVDVELKGEPKQFDLRFLDVWVKRDGRWQIVARQSAYKTPAK